MSAFLNRAQTADWLKLTPQKFAKMRKGELKEKGFPEPAYGTRQGERWSLLDLEAWERARMPDHLRPLSGAAGSDDAVAAELDRRAGALANGRTRH
jgi:hypothetical protein